MTTSPAGRGDDGCRSVRAGVLYGLAAYGWWGLVAIYFKAVAHVAPLEVLAHRTIWSFVLLSVWVAARRQGAALLVPLRHARTAVSIVATTILIATNWFIFIWAVTNAHVLEASLGYFINPLVNVLLGLAFLGERLRRAQVISVLLATAGVLYMTVSYGRVPLVSLTLAISFGLYGLLRKRSQIGGPPGLLLETGLLAPVAISYLVFLGRHDALSFGAPPAATSVLLLLSGAVTALPLIWFVEAARRLRLVTLGFLQYISPSLQFVLGVAAFGEPFTPELRVAFACIWTALVIFTADAARAGRANRSAAVPAPVEPD